MSGGRQRTLTPPNAAVSAEEAREVYNEDVEELSPSELAYEMDRAARIAKRDPLRMVWRGVTPITAEHWADERIRLIQARLQPVRPPRNAPAKPKTTPWI